MAKCPEVPALTSWVARLAQVQDVDVVLDPLCVVGRFPEPARAIKVWIWERDDGPDSHTGITDRVFVVDADGAVSADTALYKGLPPGLVDGSDETLRAEGLRTVDFDGDGTDEIVFVRVHDQGGLVTRTLIVLRLSVGEWNEALDRTFEHDDETGENLGPSCSASWRVAPSSGGRRSLVFTPESNNSGRVAECVTSKETWVLGKDGGFTTTSPTRSGYHAPRLKN